MDQLYRNIEDLQKLSKPVSSLRIAESTVPSDRKDSIDKEAESALRTTNSKLLADVADLQKIVKDKEQAIKDKEQAIKDKEQAIKDLVATRVQTKSSDNVKQVPCKEPTDELKTLRFELRNA